VPELGASTACQARATTLSDLAHLNFVAYWRHSVGWATGGWIREEARSLFFTTAVPTSMGSSGVLRLDPEVDPKLLIARADELFGSSASRYFVTLRDTDQDEDLQAACQAAGLLFLGWEHPAMVCPGRPPDECGQGRFELRQVASVQEAADFVRVSAESYASLGREPEQISAAFDWPVRLLSSQEVTSLVAYLDDKPVGAGQLLLHHAVGGLYWVGTVPAARRQGIGTALSTALTNRAFDKGAVACTAGSGIGWCFATVRTSGSGADSARPGRARPDRRVVASTYSLRLSYKLSAL
jgi:ribosomal protein S18 acetylase RimI-like enzyme